MRATAPERSVAVNLLMPFIRRSHVEACLEARIDVAVMAFGMDRSLLQSLTEHGVFVFVMVGTEGAGTPRHRLRHQRPDRAGLRSGWTPHG